MRHQDCYESEDGEMAQMLLAAGVVLLMSLLSMAVYGVKVAGLGQPYDPASDAVIDTSAELQSSFQPLIENRSNDLVASGLSNEDAIWTALIWTHDDLLHHGELRGVEIKMLTPNVTVVGEVFSIDVEVGIADRHARLLHNLTATIDLS